MLNNISWASYSTVLSILLVIYYSFVIIILYSNELQNYFEKFKGLSKLSPLRNYKKQESKNPELIGNNSNDEEKIDLPVKLLSDIQSIIKNGTSRNFIKEELIIALKPYLEQHEAICPGIKKETINNYIKVQFENYCSIHLTVDEVNMLWM
jgi:hypothetical protein